MNKLMIVSVALAGLLAGCFTSSTGPLATQEDGKVALVRTIPATATRTAIVNGAQKRGWLVKKEVPGCITLELSIRAGKHIVTVNVPYDESSFSIKYVDSVNMDYNPATGEIRQKYIQWVRNLKQEISLEAGKIQ